MNECSSTHGYCSDTHACLSLRISIQSSRSSRSPGGAVRGSRRAAETQEIDDHQCHQEIDDHQCHQEIDDHQCHQEMITADHTPRDDSFIHVIRHRSVVVSMTT